MLVTDYNLGAYRSAKQSSKDPTVVTLGQLVNAIQTGGSGLRDITARYRSIASPDEAKTFKASTFPGVTVAGVVQGFRAGGVPEQHTGLYQVDLDGVDADQAPAIRDAVAAFSSTVLAFVSPSFGVKAVVKADAPPMLDRVHQIHHWTHANECVLAFLRSKGWDLDYANDQHVKAVNGLMFVCHDTDARYNPDAPAIPVPPEPEPQTPPPVQRQPFAQGQGDDTNVNDALMQVPCPADYETWMKLSASFRAAGGEFDTWIAWCASGKGYNPATVNLSKWDALPMDAITHKTFWRAYYDANPRPVAQPQRASYSSRRNEIVIDVAPDAPEPNPTATLQERLAALAGTTTETSRPSVDSKPEPPAKQAESEPRKSRNTDFDFAPEPNLGEGLVEVPSFLADGSRAMSNEIKHVDELTADERELLGLPLLGGCGSSGKSEAELYAEVAVMMEEDEIRTQEWLAETGLADEPPADTSPEPDTYEPAPQVQRHACPENCDGCGKQLPTHIARQWITTCSHCKWQSTQPPVDDGVLVTANADDAMEAQWML